MPVSTAVTGPASSSTGRFDHVAPTNHRELAAPRAVAASGSSRRSVRECSSRRPRWSRRRVLAAQSAPETAIRFRAVLTPDGLLPNATIYVIGDRIERIDQSEPAAGVATIDLRRYTAIPGLIDLHVHATYFWDRKPGTRPWQQLGKRPAPTLLVLAEDNLRRALETGVTTMRDLHSRDRMAVYLRDLIDSGYVAGPRAVRRRLRPRDAAGADLVRVGGARRRIDSQGGRRPDRRRRRLDQDLRRQPGVSDDLSGNPDLHPGRAGYRDRRSAPAWQAGDGPFVWSGGRDRRRVRRGRVDRTRG